VKERREPLHKQQKERKESSMASKRTGHRGSIETERTPLLADHARKKEKGKQEKDVWGRKRRKNGSGERVLQGGGKKISEVTPALSFRPHPQSKTSRKVTFRNVARTKKTLANKQKLRTRGGGRRGDLCQGRPPKITREILPQC